MAKVSGAVFLTLFWPFALIRRSWLRKSVRPTLVMVMSIRDPSVHILWPRVLDYLFTLSSFTSAGSLSEVSDLNPPFRNYCTSVVWFCTSCFCSLFTFCTFLSCDMCQYLITCPWTAFWWSFYNISCCSSPILLQEPQTVSLSPAHSAFSAVLFLRRRLISLKIIVFPPSVNFLQA